MRDHPLDLIIRAYYFAFYGDDGEDVAELDVSTVVTEAQRTKNTFGYSGDGIKVGQLDGGVPDLTNAQLVSGASHFHINPDSTGTTSNVEPEHATGVACIIAGRAAQGYTAGIAPYADVYCVSYKLNGIVSWLESTEWLVTNGVNVINASLRFGNDASDSYGNYSKWLDHLAKNHYVTFVKSSGNSGPGAVTSGGMAYNIITVGNMNDNNTLSLSDDALHGFSSYYTHSTNLTYKPDLCAPGTNIVNSRYPYGMTGTSAAAPHVTGTIALMFEARPSLMLHPETVKAILTATVNPDANHRYCVTNWSSNTSVDSYAKYGSGLLDTYYALIASRNIDYRYTTLTSTNYVKDYTMNVSSVGSTVRVSIAFLNNKTATGTHTNLNDISTDDIQDIDLWVSAPDDTLVGNSLTLYSNVENVEFTSTQTGNYTIGSIIKKD